MSKHRFYFHLLQVTIVQMLKAHGFDRADNQHVLEVFTDIAIRYFNLLIRTVLKYMSLRGDVEPNIEDITHAFLELKVIRPSKELDKFDVNPLTNIGIENFEKWFNHDMNSRMREIARPNREFLEQNKKAKLMSLNVNSKMENLTKALDEQTKQAELQNPTMPYLPPPSVTSSKPTPTPYNMNQNFHFSNSQQQQSYDQSKDTETNNAFTATDYEIPPSAIDEDWVQYLVRDQILTYLVTNGPNQQTNSTTQTPSSASHNDMRHFKPSLFKGTVLSEYIPQDLKHLVDANSKETNDFLIAGPMPANLLHACPYYKSDDEGDDEYDEESDQDEDEDDGNNNDDEADHTGNTSTNTGNHGGNTNTDANRMDVDNNVNSGLAAYDYYEHHKLYEDEMEDLDLYGQDDANTNGLNLFG